MKAPRLILLAALLISAARAEWQPAPSSLLTEWGQQVKPETAWQEYPRPALAREQWTNLNGLWNYALTPQTEPSAPSRWDGEILVPFAMESALSGVKKRVAKDQALWYRRSFPAPALRDTQRLLLHFEAVDYQSTVWINGTRVGSHTGGNLPFSLDITGALQSGDNTLTVRVTDATDTFGAYQLHGKQVTDPQGIWYTPVTGIWQTVWLETVPAVHITRAKITPSISGQVKIELTTNAPLAQPASVTASCLGNPVATVTGPQNDLVLRIPEPKLWSPDSPVLYDLSICAGEDRVTCYTGLRETSVVKDAEGHLRLALNGQVLFHWGTLDQGWWPDGLLTPPSDAAMRSDIEFLKAAGFNALRKHIKVEPRRYYTHCDRLGILLWQDQVSQGTGKKRGDEDSSPAWTRLQPGPVDATWPDAAHEQYMTELRTMVDTLHAHPSIVMWVPFNEAWGQHRSVEVGQWLTAYDPTRQVNIASGGNFWPAGHIVDHHQYPHPGFPFELGAAGRFDGFVKIVGEFGGHGFPVAGHLWNPEARNWGYGGLPKDKAEWVQRYQTSIAMLNELRGQGIAAGIYTQTTDVEGEINGLLTYDRKVAKIPAAQLAAISHALSSPPPRIKTLLPVSSDGWKYRTQAPGEGWTGPGFDDAAWTSGRSGFGTRATRGLSIATEWSTPDIWLRKTFEAGEKLTGGSLRVTLFHDEDAEIYLNGEAVATLTGYTGQYQTVALDAKAIELLRPGQNLLAIHVRQTRGGQGIDAGLSWSDRPGPVSPAGTAAP